MHSASDAPSCIIGFACVAIVVNDIANVCRMIFRFIVPTAVSVDRKFQEKSIMGSWISRKTLAENIGRDQRRLVGENAG